MNEKYEVSTPKLETRVEGKLFEEELKPLKEKIEQKVEEFNEQNLGYRILKQTKIQKEIDNLEDDFYNEQNRIEKELLEEEKNKIENTKDIVKNLKPLFRKSGFPRVEKEVILQKAYEQTDDYDTRELLRQYVGRIVQSGKNKAVSRKYDGLENTIEKLEEKKERRQDSVERMRSRNEEVRERIHTFMTILRHYGGRPEIVEKALEIYIVGAVRENEEEIENVKEEIKGIESKIYKNRQTKDSLDKHSYDEPLVELLEENNKTRLEKVREFIRSRTSTQMELAKELGSRYKRYLGLKGQRMLEEDKHVKNLGQMYNLIDQFGSRDDYRNLQQKCRKDLPKIAKDLDNDNWFDAEIEEDVLRIETSYLNKNITSALESLMPERCKSHTKEETKYLEVSLS